MRQAALVAGLALVLPACAAGGQPGPTASSSGAAAPSTSAPGSDASGPTGAAPATSAAATHPVTTVVVSDDPALAAGPPAAGTWPAELAGLVADDGAPLELGVAAAEGAGFAPGGTGPSFADLVARDVVHSTQLVVLSETTSGTAPAADVGRGAEEALAAVERAAPDALVVLVAPWGSEADPDVRAALGEAAAGAEVTVTYVDPVAEGWPAGADPQQVAQLLVPHVGPLAQALTRSGAFD